MNGGWGIDWEYYPWASVVSFCLLVCRRGSSMVTYLSAPTPCAKPNFSSRRVNELLGCDDDDGADIPP